MRLSASHLSARDQQVGSHRGPLGCSRLSATFLELRSRTFPAFDRATILTVTVWPSVKLGRLRVTRPEPVARRQKSSIQTVTRRPDSTSGRTVTLTCEAQPIVVQACGTSGSWPEADRTSAAPARHTVTPRTAVPSAQRPRTTCSRKRPTLPANGRCPRCAHCTPRAHLPSELPRVRDALPSIAALVELPTYVPPGSAWSGAGHPETKRSADPTGWEYRLQRA